jgi:hypothetical protein
LARGNRASGGTPHSCGCEPTPFNLLPDKSGVPAETMRLDVLHYQAAPNWRQPQKSPLVKIAIRA